MPKIEHKLIPKKLHKLIQIDYPITEDGYYEYVLDRDKFQDKLLRYINETFPDVEVMSQTQHYFEDTQDKYFNFGFAGESCTLLFDYYATDEYIEDVCNKIVSFVCRSKYLFKN